MNEIGAIPAVVPSAGPTASAQVSAPSSAFAQNASEATPQAAQAASSDFASMLGEAISTLDSKVAEADRMVTEFALNENTPIHHVTIALEEARVAVELATQVRQRLTEGYRTLMNMQL